MYGTRAATAWGLPPSQAPSSTFTTQMTTLNAGEVITSLTLKNVNARTAGNPIDWLEGIRITTSTRTIIAGCFVAGTAGCTGGNPVIAVPPISNSGYIVGSLFGEAAQLDTSQQNTPWVISMFGIKWAR